MIQRIQSIYLLLAGIVSAIGFFVPAFNLTGGILTAETGGATATFCHMSGTMLPEHPILWATAALGTLAFGLTVAAIFLYGNRKRQMTWCSAACLCNVAQLAAAITYAVLYANAYDASIGVRAAMFQPIVSLVIVALAHKAIARDEALVRAADRIR